MALLAPLWLIGVAPWAALALYLLAGRTPSTRVPFLPLWQGHPERSPLKRRFCPPPAAIVAALLAILLCLLSASQPVIRAGKRGTSTPVIRIVDRGITMSARSAFLKSAWQEVDGMVGVDSTDMITVPPGPRDQPTALDTTEDMDNAVHAALRNTDAIVIVFTDRRPSIFDNRLVVVSPETPVSNIAIAHLAVRNDPWPQAMVRVANDSSLTQTTLTVSAATRPMTVQLPPRGESASYFVDLNSTPDIVEASISPGGDIALDDRAWVVRTGDWPIIEARIPLSPELQRLVDVYHHDRPPGGASKTVAILSDLDAITDEPSIVIDVNASSHPNEVPRAAADPLTSAIDWPAALADASIAEHAPAGWQRLVWIGDCAVVAVRQTPNRQAWVGFHSRNWAQTPDFVVFWTRLFDWVGHGNPVYQSFPVSAAHPLPGIFSDRGQTVAFNAPYVKVENPPSNAWRTKLMQLVGAHPSADVHLAPWTLLAALLSLLVSSILWRPDKPIQAHKDSLAD